jgi:hypothetical protein
MVNYADKYGLPKDRIKLEAGLEDFDITKIQIVQSKKKYTQNEEGIDGNIKIVKKVIDIAYIDVLFEGDKEAKKFYSPNSAIVSACKNMLKDFGKPDGSLKEPMRIDAVKEGASESGKTYLFFA